MPATRHTLGALSASALALFGVLGAAGPAAAAEPPTKDVQMAHPLGGTHTVRFGALTICSWADGKGNGPVRQTLSANALDVTVAPVLNPLDLSATSFPFNSATVEWTNTATGATGRQTVSTLGPEVGIRDADTGTGDLDVTVTVTRSALPTVDPGSAAPALSTTHTERLHVAGIDPVACEAAPGA